MIRWIKHPNVGTLIALSFSSAILFYLHYLYASAVLFLFIALFSLRFYNRKVPSSHIIVAIAITCLLCLPAIPQLLSIAEKSKYYQFAPEPEIGAIVNVLLKPEIFIYSTAFLITWGIFKIIGGIKGSKNPFTLIFNRPLRNVLPCILMIIFPVAFFILTWWISGVSNLVYRYFFWNIPGKVMIAGFLVSTLNQKSARLLFLSLCVVLSIMIPYNLKENWRDAVAEIRNTADSSTILIYSGLIESQNIIWLDGEKSKYFTTPVRYYWPDNRNQLVPIPIYLESDEQKEYFGRILSNHTNQGGDIYIIARTIGIKNKTSTEILREKMVHNGFKEIKYKKYEGVSLSKWRPIKDNGL